MSSCSHTSPSGFCPISSFNSYPEGESILTVSSYLPFSFPPAAVWIWPPEVHWNCSLSLSLFIYTHTHISYWFYFSREILTAQLIVCCVDTELFLFDWKIIIRKPPWVKDSFSDLLSRGEGSPFCPFPPGMSTRPCLDDESAYKFAFNQQNTLYPGVEPGTHDCPILIRSSSAMKTKCGNS